MMRAHRTSLNNPIYKKAINSDASSKKSANCCSCFSWLFAPKDSDILLDDQAASEISIHSNLQYQSFTPERISNKEIDEKAKILCEEYLLILSNYNRHLSQRTLHSGPEIATPGSSYSSSDSAFDRAESTSDQTDFANLEQKLSGIIHKLVEYGFLDKAKFDTSYNENGVEINLIFNSILDREVD